MKNSKRRMSIFVVALMVLVLISVLSVNANAATTSRLQKIMRDGVIRVAMIPDNPGYSVQNSSGNWVGYDVDIARMLATALGVKLQIVPTDGGSRLAMITANKADIVISSWVPLDERAQSVAFSMPYCASGILGLCHANKVYSSWDAIAKLRISFARGSTSEKFAMEKFPNAKLVSFDNIADAFMALKTNKVDVLLESVAQVNSLAKANPKSFVAMKVKMANPVYNSMGVAQGDPDWLNFVDNFIRNNLYNGKFESLWKANFGTPFAELYTF